MFYSGGVQIVPKKIVDYSTLRALAYWLMNDEAEGRAGSRFLIHINSFTWEKKYCIKNSISGLILVRNTPNRCSIFWVKWWNEKKPVEPDIIHLWSLRRVNLAPPSTNRRIKTPLNAGNSLLLRYFFLMEGTKWTTFGSPSNVSVAVLRGCKF